MTCSLVDVYRLTFQINLLPPPSTLVMAGQSVRNYQTTWRHITEYSYIHSHCYEKFRFQNTDNFSPAILNC